MEYDSLEMWLMAEAMKVVPTAASRSKGSDCKSSRMSDNFSGIVPFSEENSSPFPPNQGSEGTKIEMYFKLAMIMWLDILINTVINKYLQNTCYMQGIVLIGFE